MARSSESQWWAEDAARVNNLGTVARALGVTIKVDAEQPTLNPDGSLAEESSGEEDEEDPLERFSTTLGGGYSGSIPTANAADQPRDAAGRFAAVEEHVARNVYGSSHSKIVQDTGLKLKHVKEAVAQLVAEGKAEEKHGLVYPRADRVGSGGGGVSRDAGSGSSGGAASSAREGASGLLPGPPRAAPPEPLPERAGPLVTPTKGETPTPPRVATGLFGGSSSSPGSSGSAESRVGKVAGAFLADKGARYNLVDVADLSKATGHSHEEVLDTIRHMVGRGLLYTQAYEGRHGLSPEQQAVRATQVKHTGDLSDQQTHIGYVSATDEGNLRAHAATRNAFCPTGEGGGVDPSCSPGEEKEVEIHDPSSGEVYWRGSRTEGERMLREQEEVEPGHGLKLREASPTAHLEEEARRREADRRHSEMVAESIRQSSLATPHGLLPGHRDYVEPPEHLYHATFAADAIRSGGFKTSDQLGSQTLGGSSGHLVSFAGKVDAEKYRDALDVARKAAQSSLSPGEFTEAAQQFGVSKRRAAELAAQHQGAEDKWFEALKTVSVEGKQFPMFMGGGWNKSLETAKPASLVSIRAKDAKEIYYNPSEREWRVGRLGGVTANEALDTFSETLNAFCPTGSGGGIDPSCSPSTPSQEDHGPPQGNWVAPSVLPGPNKGALPTAREWVDPPLPTKREGAKAGGVSAVAGMTNTHLGDLAEHVLGKSGGYTSLLPEGQRQNPLDTRWDSSDQGFEVKAVSTSASEYKSAPKKEEVVSKLAYAAQYGYKANLLIAVVDIEAKQIHTYMRTGTVVGSLYKHGKVNNRDFVHLGTHSFEESDVEATRPKTEKATRNVFCPTGEGGGVDPSCSPGGKVDLPKTAKAAGEAMADALASVDKERFAADPGLRDKVSKNWAKQLRGKVVASGADFDALQEGLRQNASSPLFQEIQQVHGRQAVVLLDGEGLSRRAESIGPSIHVYSHKIEPLEAKDVKPTPGAATSEAHGGVAAVLRHEYAHRVLNKLPEESKRQWAATARELYPEPDDLKSELTNYAGREASKSTSRDEVFTEAFAIGTSRHYDPSQFTARAQRLIRSVIDVSKEKKS